MRYFSSSSATVTTVRKSGYYPSTIVARRLATRLAYVWGDYIAPETVQAMADGLSHGLPYGLTMSEQRCLIFNDPYINERSYDPIDDHGQVVISASRRCELDAAKALFERNKRFWGTRVPLLNLMSSEQRMIQELLSWWTADEEEPELLAQKAFIALNLNQGRSLVVIER